MATERQGVINWTLARMCSTGGYNEITELDHSAPIEHVERVIGLLCHWLFHTGF